MPQVAAPNSFRRYMRIVDPNSGLPAEEFASFCDQIWRQLAAGLPPIPCIADVTANLITLTPILHQEGGATYLDHIIFTGVASAGTTAAVTARVKSPASSTSYLSTVKVYKDNGATQAGNLDIVANSFYFFCFVQALDAGAGGLVLK